MTTGHIQEWQRAIGVRVDGDFGPRTLARSLEVLGNSDTEPPPTEPTGFTLGGQSLARLRGVHTDLVRVIKRASTMSPVRFLVLEGLRTSERQRQLYDRGATKTLNSRHLTGHAVDIAPLNNGGVSWHWPDFDELAPIIKRAAEAEGVSVEWGGDWRSFRDGPHWQLPWSKYS